MQPKQPPGRRIEALPASAYELDEDVLFIGKYEAKITGVDPARNKVRVHQIGHKTGYGTWEHPGMVQKKPPKIRL